MKEENREDGEIERLLAKARPAEPSGELKAQVIGAARDVWKETPAEDAWRIGLRRLAVSAAAALLIVSSANYFSNRAVSRWHPGRPVATRMSSADFEDMLETPYGPFMRHLVAMRKSSTPNPSALRDYVDGLRETLGGTEENPAERGT